MNAATKNIFFSVSNRTISVFAFISCLGMDFLDSYAGLAMGIAAIVILCGLIGQKATEFF